MSTWHRAEGALGVDSRLDGDDALSFRTPALLALSLHLKQVGVIWQQVLDDHRVLCRVCHVDTLHLTYREQSVDSITIGEDVNCLHKQEVNTRTSCSRSSTLTLCSLHLPPLRSW